MYGLVFSVTWRHRRQVKIDCKKELIVLDISTVITMHDTYEKHFLTGVSLEYL